MSTLEFECKEGYYINDLKYFGFLNAMDYRFNIESFGESFCLLAEQPNAPPLYLGEGKLGEPPKEKCESDEDPDEDDCEPESDDDDRRLLQDEIPEKLKNVVSIE